MPFCSLSYCAFPITASVPVFLFQTLLLTYFIPPRTQLPSLDPFTLGSCSGNAGSRWSLLTLGTTLADRATPAGEAIPAVVALIWSILLVGHQH